MLVNHSTSLRINGFTNKKKKLRSFYPKCGTFNTNIATYEVFGKIKNTHDILMKRIPVSSQMTS